jgi:hypothetical protein
MNAVQDVWFGNDVGTLLSGWTAEQVLEWQNRFAGVHRRKVNDADRPMEGVLEERHDEGRENP